jgi:hypothetical protein
MAAGPTLAQLGIVVALKEDGEPVVKKLEGIEKQAAKTEKATAGLTAEMKRLNQAQSSSSLARDFVENTVRQQAAMAKLAASHRSVAGAAIEHRIALGRITNALEGLTAETLGANTRIASIATKLAEFGIGGTVTVGVLAGLAAIGYAWSMMTEESRKAREENEKLLKSLDDIAKKRRETPTTGIEAAIAAGQANLAKLQADLAATQARASSSGSFLAGGVPASQARKAAEEVETQTRKIAAAQAVLADAYRKAAIERDQAIAMQGLELEKQRALNDAHGSSALALKLIEIRYDTMAQKLQNAAGHTAEQAAALNIMTDAIAAQRIEAAKLDDATKSAAFTTAFYQNRMDGILASLEKTTPKVSEYTKRNLELHAVLVENNKLINEFKPKPAAPPAALSESAKLFEQFTRGLQDDLARGIADGFINGLSSAQKFTDSVFRLFVDLAARLGALKIAEKALGSDDLAALSAGNLKALSGRAQIGLSAGVGASVGYGSGSATAGALSGVIAGAMTGNPFAAIAGGLAGLAGGLLGGAKAARERAEAEHQLQVALYANIEQLKVQLGVTNAVNGALAQSHTQFEQLRKQTEEALAGRANAAERNRVLAELNDLEKKRTEQLVQEAKNLVVTNALENARNNQQAGEDLRRASLSPRPASPRPRRRRALRRRAAP